MLSRSLFVAFAVGCVVVCAGCAGTGPGGKANVAAQGIAPDMEPTHPKMGFLVKEAAEQSGELLRRKRS